MTCIVGRKKRLIHNAPYAMYLSVSRITSQVDLCCIFRAVTPLLRIPFFYYSFCVLPGYAKPNCILANRSSRESNARKPNDDLRFVRCRIFSGDVTHVHRSCVHAPHAASCNAHERSLTISVRVKYVTRHRRKLRTGSRNCCG